MNAPVHHPMPTPARRLLLGLLLALSLLPGSIGRALPVQADEPIVRDHREPDQRIVVVVKRIIVHDDMDIGEGEIAISYQVRTNTERCDLNHTPDCGRVLVEGKLSQFVASTGESQRVDQVIPSEADSMADRSVSPEIGIPIRAGQWSGVTFNGAEDDQFRDDDLGQLNLEIVDEQGRVQFGTRTERALDVCRETAFEFCGSSPLPVAAFSVEYEIREAPLPDLRPVDITITDLPGSPKKRVCMVIQNAGVRDAGTFEAAFKVDGVEAPDARTASGGLTSGDAADLCVETALPTSGAHRFSVAVDEARIVSESNETNNVYVQPNSAFSYSVAIPVFPAGPATTGGPGNLSTDPTRWPTVTAATPTPKPNAALPDLTVSATKVNGQVPDGKDDCKDGKNTVTVTVKNAGKADAGKHALELAVDGSPVAEESVSDLKAGQEREVNFGDVRLKKGPHTVSATVDGKEEVAESNESNNARTVPVRCSDDD